MKDGESDLKYEFDMTASSYVKWGQSSEDRPNVKMRYGQYAIFPDVFLTYVPVNVYLMATNKMILTTLLLRSNIIIS